MANSTMDILACQQATMASAVEAGFAEHDVKDIVVAVCEACANAVAHGLGNGGTRVTLSLNADERGLQAIVCDDGPGFSCPGETDMPAPWADRGRGIPLMKLLMDDVRFESRGGCCVILTKHRGSGTAAG